MSKLIAVVMAAGHGTRMKSSLPKVLHPACGRPLVYYPVRAALDLGADQVVVVANPATLEPVVDTLSKHISREQFELAVQEVPRGTGDAARSGVAELDLSDDDYVLILSGDVPLLRHSDLKPLVDLVKTGPQLSFMSFQAEVPHGYGRILRDAQGRVIEIREERDLRNDAERSVQEVNAGVYCARAGSLQRALASLSPENAQGEYYLTDIVAFLAQKESVHSVLAAREVLAGVNDRSQLAAIENIIFERIRRRLAESGVSVVGHPLIDDTVEIAADVRIEDGVRLRGQTQIGEGTLIDVGCVIQDCRVGKNTTVKPYSVLTESQVGDSVQLGPFAHIRPESILEDECHIGNFVETKKTLVKRGAKANHLAYLGDAEVGEKSNLGAGTIICNYDGFQKQRTVIGKGVFIGSDSQLVAPVTIGDDAYVATATTVTSDVPAGSLAIGRARQVNKEGYAAPLREKFKHAAAAAKAAAAKVSK